MAGSYLPSDQMSHDSPVTRTLTSAGSACWPIKSKVTRRGSRLNRPRVSRHPLALFLVNSVCTPSALLSPALRLLPLPLLRPLPPRSGSISTSISAPGIHIQVPLHGFLIPSPQKEEARKNRTVRSMESGGNCMGIIAVVAVTGSVALACLHAQKRLYSDYIKKLQSEIGGERPGGRRRTKKEKKKKVRFAPDVVEPSANNEEYRRRMAAEALARRTGRSIEGGS